jgi:hypothetical protein
LADHLGAVRADRVIERIDIVCIQSIIPLGYRAGVGEVVGGTRISDRVSDQGTHSNCDEAHAIGKFVFALTDRCPILFHRSRHK